MTMRLSQAIIGIFPAAENLRTSQYYGVSLTTDENGQPAWAKGGSNINGVLLNNPTKGEVASVVFSGVVPVQLESGTSVDVGDTLVANLDGTFSKGPGVLTALFPTTTGGIIPAFVGKFNPWTQENQNFVFVSSLNDLPLNVGGVIQLADNVTYFLTKEVDILGNRLVGGRNSVIVGGSSENCILKSTGLTGPLITSQYSLPIRNIGITANHALDLDAVDSNQALDWFGVNFLNCNSIGTIKNYSNFVMGDSAFLSSGGLTFDGTIGTIAFSQCLFDTAPNQTAITLPPTASITRRFRIIYSSFVALPGETGLSISASAAIPIESYILDTVNFGGGGTYASGVTYRDNKSLFVNCKGIGNSAQSANYYFNDNVTATPIAVQGTFYPVIGTFIEGQLNQKFTVTGVNQDINYVGGITRLFKVTGVLTAISSNNQLLSFMIGKNNAEVDGSTSKITTSGSGRSENIKISSVVELSSNDFVNILVTNNTSTSSVTITDFSVIIEALT